MAPLGSPPRANSNNSRNYCNNWVNAVFPTGPLFFVPDAMQDDVNDEDIDDGAFIMSDRNLKRLHCAPAPHTVPRAQPKTVTKHNCANIKPPATRSSTIPITVGIGTTPTGAQPPDTRRRRGKGRSESVPPQPKEPSSGQSVLSSSSAYAATLPPISSVLHPQLNNPQSRQSCIRIPGAHRRRKRDAKLSFDECTLVSEDLFLRPESCMKRPLSKRSEPKIVTDRFLQPIKSDSNPTSPKPSSLIASNPIHVAAATIQAIHRARLLAREVGKLPSPATPMSL